MAGPEGPIYTIEQQQKMDADAAKAAKAEFDNDPIRKAEDEGNFDFRQEKVDKAVAAERKRLGLPK